MTFLDATLDDHPPPSLDCFQNPQNTMNIDGGTWAPGPEKKAVGTQVAAGLDPLTPP